ncbi:DUF819 family protein [Cyanobium sp. HWJ4-Hawea]|uniref:DUF819 family protein n=1 Tax=Cyanobium sp. HWJ4-Hawea TaxID=2823713 RepID=UPI0020CF8F43|nr:DUF819 family protein [Cyanobium sp. HWJ4-Hawea]MCP9809724.1 DUF819 family protein [Cyanobium sp. HWJ4-Hawea]
MLRVVLDLLLVSVLIASSLALARFTRRGGQLGAPILVLLLSMAVAGTGFVPGAIARQWISGPVTALAIAVLILPLDLRRLLPQGRALLKPFALAIVLVCAAAVLFGLLLSMPLGQANAAIAGVLAAGFTGGTVNQVAVAESLALAPPLFALVLAADNLTGILWFLICMAAGLGLAADTPPALASEQEKPQGDQPREQLQARLRSLVVGLGVVVLAFICQRLLLPWQLPLLLVVTSLAVLIAQLPTKAAPQDDPELGLLLMLPFFSMVGLSTPWRELLPAGIWLLLFCIAIVAVQGLVLWLLARGRRASLERALVASMAAIGGPSTAVAIALGLGRRDLLLPGTALGMIGYLMGSYLGLGVARTVGLFSGGQ